LDAGRTNAPGEFLKPLNGGLAVLALWPTSNPDAAAPDRVLIAEPRASIWQGRISPNGRWLSFVVERQSAPGWLEMAVAPFDSLSSDHWIRIAPDHQWPDKPRWALDGRPIGEPFAITKIDSPALIISSKIGFTEMLLEARRLVLTMQSNTGNIWMLGNVDR
jgi:hypothetical protein